MTVTVEWWDEGTPRSESMVMSTAFAEPVADLVRDYAARGGAPDLEAALLVVRGGW